MTRVVIIVVGFALDGIERLLQNRWVDALDLDQPDGLGGVLGGLFHFFDEFDDVVVHGLGTVNY